MHWEGWVHSVVCIVWGGYMCGFGRGMDIITSAMLYKHFGRGGAIPPCIHVGAHGRWVTRSVYKCTPWSIKNGKTQCIHVIDVDLRTSWP